MKQPFYGYYPPTDKEYERLWSEAIVVPDTNVLLNLYRLPATARDELFGVLEKLKERLWIPHQVALEFHRQRLTVIASERKASEEALEAASQLVVDLKRRVEGLQIGKRGVGVDAQPLLVDLEKSNTNLVEAIRAAHKAQQDISAIDPIRDRLDSLFEGRIGTGPSTQAELDALAAEGEERYKNRTPPGWADAEKEKNPNEALFFHDGLKYQRKFGDLILWRQLIEHAKQTAIKAVLFVTADRKEDWWWREQGKTIGPQPELVREIMRQGDVDLYWMYSSVQFVEHANKYLATAVSREAVDELKQVGLAPSLRNEKLELADTLETGDSTSEMEIDVARPRLSFISEPDTQYRYAESRARLDYRGMELAVAEWLASSHGALRHNSRGFPDFLVEDGDDLRGFEVKPLRSLDRVMYSSLVLNGLLQGYAEQREGRLSEFTLVLVAPEESMYESRVSPRELRAKLRDLLARYPITAIVVGLYRSSRFEPLFYERSVDRG